MSAGRYDAIVAGGGHNGLVAAAYLARAGLRVRVCERLPATGGAAASAAPFPGVDARLSRFAYLVSLLPDRIVSDLGLRFSARSRSFGSCTPVGDTALLVEREPGTRTAASFEALTGSPAEFAAWESFHALTAAVAQAVWPTMLDPLPTRAELRGRCDPAAWEALVERPLGEVLEATFADDTVRGLVFTDALIGTFTHAHDPSLRQNRCFLYHVIGDGTGEWRVPVGGMGALSAELERAARDAGAEIATSCEVTAIATDGATAHVTVRAGDGEQTLEADHLLSGVAPATLAHLLGEEGPAGATPEGSSAKVNMLVTHLPALRSGTDPAEAFAGTFHVDEGYAASQAAYESAAAGRMPDRPPAELYCHSLTDPSVLGAELRASGAQTLTLFGVHLPARLFEGGNEAARAALAERLLDGLDRHLAEPIRGCLARDARGNACLEVHTPVDLQAELGLPGGHIFHGDLSWPWAEDREAHLRWGAETAHANVWLCGAGARRGGGVSGVAGHNAAMAVLERAAQQA